jgi:hypothetical protein
METCDRLAIAFGCLFKPTPNNSITDKKAKTIVNDMQPEILPDSPTGESCQYVIFNPIDFHYFLIRNKRIEFHFDRETQQRLVKRGIVGYLWGATVLLDKNVVMGHAVLSPDIREKALKSKKSIIVQLQTFDTVPRDFEGIAETRTDWTESET